MVEPTTTTTTTTGNMMHSWIRQLFLALAIVNCVVFYNLHGSIFSEQTPDDEQIMDAPRFSSLTSPASSSARGYSCGYRDFPYPERHSGLPWLFEAFSTNTTEYALFIGMHRGQIHPQFHVADNFLANTTTGITHRFLCMFQGETPVMSNPVHPIPDGRYQGRENLMTFLVHCKIPEQYRSMIAPGQQNTNLKVDLLALYDVEDTSHIERAVSEAPKIEDIAICHPANVRPQQFRMIAHTRIRSNYNFINKKRMYRENYRIPEWIEYHQYQGFDHFVIYDNDLHDDGPLVTLLEPYINSGLVTRIWNPMNESTQYYMPSFRTCHAQGGASIAALHRFGFATKYFANMDVDEFFVPLNQSKSVLDMTEEMLGTDPPPNIDGIKWQSRVMAYCNGDPVVKGGSELMKRCQTGSGASGPKQIFLADRIWLYHTHHAFLTSNLTKPKIRRILTKNEGFLAHFRRTASRTWKVRGGKAISAFTEPGDYFGAFLGYKKTLTERANATAS